MQKSRLDDPANGIIGRVNEIDQAPRVYYHLAIKPEQFTKSFILVVLNLGVNSKSWVGGRRMPIQYITRDTI